MANDEAKPATINDAQLQFIKEIGHEPHFASQLLNFCKQKNLPFKYKDIKKWWPNRAKTKGWLQNSTNTAYLIHSKSKVHKSTNIANKEEMIRTKIANITQQHQSDNQSKQTDQVFYDPTIKCYDGNAKIDKTKAKSYTLTDKDYIKYHKFQEKQDTNYKSKNKFYVENVKCLQKKVSKKGLKQSSSASKQTDDNHDNDNDNEPSLKIPSYNKWQKEFVRNYGEIKVNKKSSEITSTEIKHSRIVPLNETFDASHEYLHLLQTIVYGYLRISSLQCNMFIPSELKRLCYLWYHPNTIYLMIITETKQHFSIGIIPTETIFDLKQKIEARESVSVKNQRLIQPNLGKTLLDKFHIADYNLHNNDVLQLKIQK